MKSIFTFFISLVFLIVPAQQQQKFGELDSLANYFIDSYNIRGMGIVAVKDGAVVYNKGFGKANDIYKFNSDTPLYIASNTKAFVGLAMLKLINQKKLTLDDKFIDYIDSKYFPKNIEVNTITIRDLISHTTGLSNDPLTFRTSSSGELPNDLQDLLIHTVYKKDNTSLEKSFSYSNLGYLLCGIIIEHLTGYHWKEYLEKEILNPLQLSNTAPYLPQDELAEKMAMPYIFFKDSSLKLVKQDNTLHAAGGLFTNLDDMGRWLTMLTTIENNQSMLNMPEFNGYLDTLINTIDSFGPITIDGYGYGWYYGNVLGMPINFHAGGFSGHNSFISFLPDKQLGIFVFMNENSNLRLAALQLTFLYYYLETANENLKSTFPIFEKRIKSVYSNHETRTLIPIDNSKNILPIGSFYNEKYGTLTIDKIQTNYLITLGPNLESLAYIDSDDKSFRVQFIPESDVHFKIEGEGEDLKIKYGEDYGYFSLIN